MFKGIHFQSHSLFKNLRISAAQRARLHAGTGEIACRVIRTAKKLGVKSVAVYSIADSNALHVKMADEAYCIGPAPANQSYLNKSEILKVVQKSGAQGVHPGYGFLSENADFAEYLENNNVSFIGPPPSAIRDMGSKSTSKKIMEAANVPVVPGYHGSNQDPDFLKQEANKIGYPVLIKAVLGGGGKGMRIVQNEQEFQEKLEASKRESMKSFNDDNVLIEKYIVDPRHVEVQVFADKYGNTVYLFERDCSVQRRHQKIIEESPAPHLSAETRRILGEKAVAAAKAVNYVGAGTVEFIMDSRTQEFYFMEMNTRLQVEHPVTEMVTGTDLVEWQLNIAAGNKLTKTQDEIPQNGHSFEARIYAENPQNNFLPDTGKLVFMSTPEPSENVRVETGVRQGDDISVNYDPMIAKLVVHGEDRGSALKLLIKSLNEFRISGLITNIEFLKKVVSVPDFKDGKVETGFIEKHRDILFESKKSAHCQYLIQSAFAVFFIKISSGSSTLPNSGISLASGSPWDLNDSFRMSGTGIPSYKTVLRSNDEDYSVSITQTFGLPNAYSALVTDSKGNTLASSSFTVQQNESLKLTFDLCPKLEFNIEIDGVLYKPVVVVQGSQISLFEDTTRFDANIIDKNEELRAILTDSGEKTGSIRAPMSSNIVQVLVSPGQEVDIGTQLVILEAMKMEHVIKSPKKGKIDSVKFKVGDLVSEGQELVSFLGEEKSD
ncbi:hypothetical protein BB560_000041 [Smittium megazygosporum]|uniref:Methylcrotonoyl-CoA carboxylase subunit alpha, mitochondrial n=1 Tax=Smittium megazygosporum TaxID=133381 RepID=A0A2T9ZLI2_9FUNG|nr:hypothetical protein BB560_000041 [Smittium megazygosporum]